jgi:hypothetical protein
MSCRGCANRGGDFAKNAPQRLLRGFQQHIRKPWNAPRFSTAYPQAAEHLTAFNSYIFSPENSLPSPAILNFLCCLRKKIIKKAVFVFTKMSLCIIIIKVGAVMHIQPLY